MRNIPVLIKRIAIATLSFYPEDYEKKVLLQKVEKLIDFLSKNQEVNEFIKDFLPDTSPKRKVLNELLKKLKFDEIFLNSVNLLLDKNLIFHFFLFLNRVKEEILFIFNIKNVYIYSSIQIEPDQRKKLEEAWVKKIKKNCIFHYLIDPTLRMGIKVQIDDYIEEYSVNAELEKLKDKFLKSLNI